MIPLGTITLLLSLAAVAVSWRSRSKQRQWAMIAALCALGVMLSYPVFFAGANASFIAGGLSDSAVRALLDQWAVWALGSCASRADGILGCDAGTSVVEPLKIPTRPRITTLVPPFCSERAPYLTCKEVLPVAARALGVTVRRWEVRDAGGFERVFAALNKERPDGLYVTAGPLMNVNQKRIADFTLKSRLPSMYGSREFVDAGGLMSYSADLSDSYRRVAYFVDRILKGTKPADLPVEQPTKFEFIINLKTAKQIGLTIPQSMLYRADKVIK